MTCYHKINVKLPVCMLGYSLLNMPQNNRKQKKTTQNIDICTPKQGVTLWNYDTENHTENSQSCWKTWEQKEWVTLKIFQCDLKLFSVISVSLNNKGKYFSEIILDYHCDFLCKCFSVLFPYLFSVTKISVWFSVS